MTALPAIKCNGYFFTPKEPFSEVIYSITSLESENYLITTFKNNISQGDPQEIDPDNCSLSIVTDLQIMIKAEARSTLSMLGALVSAVVSAYLFAIKNNYKLGTLSAVLAGGCSIGAWYFNRQCREASFNVANQMISVLQKKTEHFNRVDYSSGLTRAYLNFYFLSSVVV